MKKSKIPPKGHEMLQIPITNSVIWSIADTLLKRSFEHRPAAAKRAGKKLGMPWEEAWDTIVTEAGFAKPD